MQICTSLQTDNHAAPTTQFFTGRMPFLPPSGCCMPELICVSFLRPNLLQRFSCSMPSAVQFIGVGSGFIISKSPFAAYILLSLMLYGFCWKCLLGLVPVSCLCIMVLLLLWAVIHKQPFSLLCLLYSCNNVIIGTSVSCNQFWRSPILAKWRNDLHMWLSLCQWLSLSLSLFFSFFSCLFLV